LSRRGSDWPIAALNQAFDASQDKLAALVPEARHVIAARSGHYIQLNQPKLVIDAIRWAVKGPEHISRRALPQRISVHGVR
jgi:hypothetical protein